MIRFFLRFLPCEVTTFFYIATAVLSAGATISQIRATTVNEELRQQNIENEKTAAELAALDDEVSRQQDLRYANATAIVNAGNLDPFGSASLLAGRRFNQKQTERQVRNIALNLGFAKAGASNAILASDSRIRGAEIGGAFRVGSTLLGAARKIHKAGKE